MTKYNDDFTADMVKEHGEWCLARMLGRNAERAAVPASSVPGYIARERHVLDILADNERRRD